jgi:hypothetical protein
MEEIFRKRRDINETGTAIGVSRQQFPFNFMRIDRHHSRYRPCEGTSV